MRLLVILWSLAGVLTGVALILMVSSAFRGHKKSAEVSSRTEGGEDTEAQSQKMAEEVEEEVEEESEGSEISTNSVSGLYSIQSETEDGVGVESVEILSVPPENSEGDVTIDESGEQERTESPHPYQIESDEKTNEIENHTNNEHLPKSEENIEVHHNLFGGSADDSDILDDPLNEDIENPQTPDLIPVSNGPNFACPLVSPHLSFPDLNIPDFILLDLSLFLFLI
jgi:hypothetical protein